MKTNPDIPKPSEFIPRNLLRAALILFALYFSSGQATSNFPLFNEQPDISPQHVLEMDRVAFNKFSNFLENTPVEYQTGFFDQLFLAAVQKEQPELKQLTNFLTIFGSPPNFVVMDVVLMVEDRYYLPNDEGFFTPSTLQELFAQNPSTLQLTVDVGCIRQGSRFISYQVKLERNQDTGEFEFDPENTWRQIRDWSVSPGITETITLGSGQLNSLTRPDLTCWEP